MGRCVYCHSVVTKNDESCYGCGDTVPKHVQFSPPKSRPVSGLTNVVFLASLAFTGYCFLGEPKLSLPVTLAISSGLLLLRLAAERLVNKKSQ
jgi:hypothetical protein